MDKPSTSMHLLANKKTEAIAPAMVHNNGHFNHSIGSDASEPSKRVRHQSGFFS